MLPALAADPNLAFFLLVLGLLGVFWELHNPGMAVPGIGGAVLIFLAGYALYSDTPTWYGLMLLVVAAVLLGIELKHFTHGLSGIAGAVFLATGAMWLLQGPRRIDPAVAIAIAVAFAVITCFLGALGMRIRRTPPLTGIQTLRGAVGRAHTDINPEGTVFVRGEYWKARSNHSIPAGRQIAVQDVKNLVVYVIEA